MRQKVVIKVGFNGEKKSRTKVMRAAVGVPGVESIAFGGEDYDQILIIGDDGLDSVNLTCLLRKKVRFAELLSVSSVEEEKEEKMNGLEMQPVVWPNNQTAGVPQYYYHTVAPGNYQDEMCNIM